MSDPELDREILSRVAVNRRTFVKRAILGTAFAVPIVASFDMQHLTAETEAARAPYGGVRRQHVSHRSAYYPSNLQHHGRYESHTEY